MITVKSLAAAALLTATLVNPAVAQTSRIFPDSSSRFLEISRKTDTWTYDLSTVQLIEPGKFTVAVTVVDNPDVLNLRVKVLDTLQTYCQRPDGQYPALASLFTLGDPDMPVTAVQVKSGHDEWMGRDHPKKEVTWRLPYRRLPERPSFVMCWGGNPPNGTEWYLDYRKVIMNGIQVKYLYDCKRGVMGNFSPVNPSSFYMTDIGGFERDYQALCQRVTGKPAYLP